jgi:hypothetical protein
VWRGKFGQATNPISHIYKKKKLQVNVWFTVNEADIKEISGYRIYKKSGKTICWYKEQEQRKESDIKKFNAFYFDIDFKQDGKHLSEDELKRKKIQFLKSMKHLPLMPNALISTKNGYHLYYAICDRDITLNEWQSTEKQMWEYIHDNVTKDIDIAVKDASRVLRVPHTLHIKDDSEPYRIKIIYVKNLRYKVSTLNKYFAQKKCVHDISLTKYRIDIENDESVKKKVISTDFTNAIKNENITYFNYLPKYNIELPYTYALNMLKQLDIRDFLNINVGINKNFKSPFHMDNHPSCVIYKDKDNNFYLYDNSTTKRYDIIDMITSITNKTFIKSFKFLTSIYKIKVQNKVEIDIDNVIEGNIKVLKEIVDKSDKKYVKNLLPTYEVVMRLWKERRENIKFENPFSVNLQLGSEYVGKQINVKTDTVRKQLLIMKFCGMIRQTISHSTKTGVSKTNTYYINDLSNRKDSICKRIDILNDAFDNVIRDISKTKIESITDDIFNNSFKNL